VDKHYEYPKAKLVADIYTSIGLGLPFLEGMEWKRRRNIFNKIFNFDFVKSLAPKMAKISDDVMKKF
jgi:cytochrome P450